MAIINSLTHKGIMLSEIPYHKLSIEINGKPTVLTPLQEQMAIAWVRKLSTVYVEDPIFGLQIPTSCEGVPSKVLIPRDTWSDKAAYDEKAKYLAHQFITNFDEFNAFVSEEIKAAAPRL